MATIRDRFRDRLRRPPTVMSSEGASGSVPPARRVSNAAARLDAVIRDLRALSPIVSVERSDDPPCWTIVAPPQLRLVITLHDRGDRVAVHVDGRPDITSLAATVRLLDSDSVMDIVQSIEDRRAAEPWHALLRPADWTRADGETMGIAWLARARDDQLAKILRFCRKPGRVDVSAADLSRLMFWYESPENDDIEFRSQEVIDAYEEREEAQELRGQRASRRFWNLRRELDQESDIALEFVGGFLSVVLPEAVRRETVNRQFEANRVPELSTAERRELERAAQHRAARLPQARKR